MDINIERARQFYNEKEWKTAIEILEPIVKNLKAQEKAEASRILGWSFYYLGIKGPEDEKMENLRKAKDGFETALKEVFYKQATRISALNGLPLTLWILEEKDRAWEISDKATEEFPDVSSVWNTRSILCRWGGKFEEALKVYDKVYETALEKGDLRTAGHGAQNLGDTLLKEAEKAYKKAVMLYKEHGKTGESASFHIESVEKKLTKL